MQLYVDESGDPGIKMNHGSSSCYVVAALIIDHPDHQQKIQDALSSAQRSLRLPPSFEFRWSRNNERIRKTVIDSIEHSWFRWRFCIHRKATPASPHPSQLLGDGVIACLSIPPPLTDITMNIDGLSHPRGITEKLRRNLPDAPQVLTRVRFLDSRRTPCLQLADYLAGMSGRWHRKGEPMDRRWLKSLDGYRLN